MAVVVRRATSEDAQTIADYALKLVAQHLDYDALRFARLVDSKQAASYYGNQTNVKDSAVLVAELEGKIIGFAFVRFDSKNYADLLESAAWLHDIYVDEEFRGSHAGKSLLEAATQAAKDFGASKLMLSVAVQNELARKVFENAGFKTTMLEMMLDLTERENND
jgi:ribosomal protein S18 acetylase RimI-like enzyme